MALRFGWRANDKRETIWLGDPALKDVPDSSSEDWRKDGDASHLRNFATAGQPTVFTFRALSFTEAEYVNGIYDQTMPSIHLMFAACFRIAVRFTGAPETYTIESTGQTGLKTIERVSGIPMLAEGFCQNLRFEYPGMVEFYGNLILNASRPTEPEKKASSPPPTPTPSSEAASTKGGTAVAGAPAEAAA